LGTGRRGSPSQLPRDGIPASVGETVGNWRACTHWEGSFPLRSDLPRVPAKSSGTLGTLAIPLATMQRSWRLAATLGEPSFIFQRSLTRKALQLIELLAIAESDQQVASFHDPVARWVKGHVALRLLDRNDYDTHLLPHFGFLKRFARQLALGGNLCLLDLQIEILRSCRQFDEIHHRRPQHRLGHPIAAYRVWRD